LQLAFQWVALRLDGSIPGLRSAEETALAAALADARAQAAARDPSMTRVYGVLTRNSVCTVDTTGTTNAR
jgi:hypothetical protein